MRTQTSKKDFSVIHEKIVALETSEMLKIEAKQLMEGNKESSFILIDPTPPDKWFTIMIIITNNIIVCMSQKSKAKKNHKNKYKKNQ